ncbi:hypothetical protein F5Y19DRAFT_477389 [Xylariaceae sp. FL1651]|nr:hypothetical protein F5Y19DRAFT_477389 [Xylariaceae sp. FL1651]
MDTNSTAPAASSTTNPPASSTLVIVIGGAIAAAESGASVRVLDSGHGGGTAAISGGVIYAGGGSREQATLRRFCHGSVASIEWLRGYGVKFAGTLCPFRTSYPPNGYYLFFSGNERAHRFVSVAMTSAAFPSAML